MVTVSVAQAKARLSELINTVEGGEEVLITRRGKAVARVSAAQPKKQRLPDLTEFRASLPKPRVPLSRVLRKMRAEGR